MINPDSILIDKEYIKILSYNIFLRPPGINTNGEDFKNERLNMFLNLIGPYDILCFQELFSFFTFRVSKMIQEGLKRGYHYYARCPDPLMAQSGVLDGGLFTLSRFPILQSKYYEFRHTAYPDSLCNKGVNEFNLYIFNTHLQASHIGSEFFKEEFICCRIGQIKEMIEFIHTIIPGYLTRKDIVLICGDFNCDANYKFDRKYVERFQNETFMQHQKDKNFYDEYQAIFDIFFQKYSYKMLDLLNIERKLPRQVTHYEEIVENEKIIITGENLMTIGERPNQSLDYVLLLQTINQDYECESIIEKFRVFNKQFDILSDHFGIVTKLKFLNSDFF